MKVAVFLLFTVFSLVLIQAAPGRSSRWDSVRNSYRNARNYVRNTYNRSKDFTRGAYRGTKDMYRAYKDMRAANWKNSDKYFHARGNRDAARHGSGGAWAARTISNVRESLDGVLKGQSAADAAADQRANRLGRNGGNINVYRPKGLPSRY